MANEIYCKTWWGDAPNTARTVNGSCDLLQGQFNLVTRVNSESGTVENTFCAAKKLHSIANI